MNRRITDIQVQKRNQGRVNVYLNGEFAFGLSRIVAAWLQVGQELSEEKVTELQDQDAREVAYQQALKFINIRARSETEVRRNLTKHSIPPEIIEETLDRLRSAGLVDDKRFARAWVENRSEFRPRSRRALTVELRQRGLEEGAIRRAIHDVDDEDLAYQAALRQTRKYQPLEWLDFRQKLAGFLARRGFHYEVILPVVKRVWDEIQAEDRETDSENNEG
jgi:regulatory protein